ncbi:hypothetical protein CBLAS_0783 [Campylobacter blaseri]|uniref:Haemolysin-type calcium binding-related domain-containing protein n=1 Tax=Campylobacter blaseri TaxID=2042961 RepID=A0A2P8R2F5_9BACT|nr:hypothetical protein [Campylobacter blaseri]PSM52672.1 hypothetical protein CQ405_02770 [Campylobacter blaseri]PSM54320.1 hypothetical protein CRN67_02770 [Campylobacter blaseri]QKF85972.1 hypothetical protein CBLAS_0783 [Campylobacter blaseri]
MSSIKQHLSDFANGFVDTFVGAPYAFGDFLARISGFRDWQENNKSVIPNLNSNYHQEQAINEMKIIYHALNNTKSIKILGDHLLNDIKTRPFYYLGGFLTTRGMEKTIPNKAGKITYKGSIVIAKADNAIHELLEDNKAFYDIINNALKNSNSTIDDFTNFTKNPIILPNPFGTISGNGFNFNDYLNQYFNPFISPTIYDPLVLDLDGDGIETLSLKDGVYFDHNGDGVKFKSSWVDKDDGLLVIDKNSNGIVDNGNELFGNFSKLNSSNHLAINGFHSLKEYDTNSDSIIDINDEEFLNLKVWQDKNSDGISQSDELKTLDELGIKYLNTNFTNETKNIDKDNTLEFSSTYTKTDKTNLKLADINFKVDTTSSMHKEKLNLTDEENKRANIKGYGFLRDLKEAATLSTNLAKTLDEYTIANTKEEQLNLIQTLIKEYSNTANKANNYELKRANLINNDLVEVKILNLVSSLGNSNLEIRDKNKIYKDIKELSLKASDDRFKVLNSMK